ncbi:membrane protein [Chromobacterium subtsugae]|uniref:COG4648 family protein n=1 Tax=Chromobacterium subtsugae TaxID=251747 RepID=UPI0006414EE6|nr:membrane protein [Chromobacterium subtsugae]
MPATALASLLTLSYPFLIYFGQGRVEPRLLAGVLVGIALLRALSTRQAVWYWAAAATLLLAAFSMLGNGLLPLKLYPLLVNAVLLAVFAGSLRFGPPLIERLARLTEPELDARAIRYTRAVTQVWCGFFIVNGSLSLATALWADNAVWTAYNGCISYLLMGALFGGEWLVRQRVKSRNTTHG